MLKRFNLQLDEYRKNNTFNRLEGLTLDNTRIIDVSTDQNIEKIDVLLTATAKDTVIDEKGVFVGGDKDFSTWDEKWTFVRNAGVKTDLQKSVFSEKCPNC